VKLILRILGWAALAGLVLVGLVEASLWLFAPVEKRVSQRFEFDNQLPGLKERVSFVVDGRSLRSWKSAVPADGREVRVLVLGGGASVALLQNNEDAWWGRLGAALQKEFPQARFHVSALSREYCTALEAAKWAETNLATLKPDVVIALLGFEDVLTHDGAYTYTPDKLATLSLDGGGRGPLKEFLVDKSQICRLLVNRGQRRALMAKLGPLGERNAYAARLNQHRQLNAQLPLAYEVERPEGRDPMAEYLDGLRALASLSQQSGAAFAVIGEPSLHRGLMDGGAERLVHRWFMLDPNKGDAGVVRLDSGWLELQLSRYYTAAEKLCASLGVPFLDPTRKLPAHPAYFVDDVMLTDEGADTLAKLVLPVVKPLVASRLQP
jgi:hypothetical protein